MEDNMRNEFNAAYRKVAEAYLAGKYGVDILDNKFAECSPVFIPAPWRDELLQDPSSMRYISLLNEAHTERLSDEDSEKLQKILRTEEDQESVIELIEKTYRTVLAGTLEPGANHEYFPDIHQEGTFPGDAIVFMFSDIPDYDEKGNSDDEIEWSKSCLFFNVKEQFEKMMKEEADEKVYLIRY